VNILFVCNQNLYRSPTAEKVFSRSRKHKAKSAGLFCDPSEGTPLSAELLEWADIVFVMEDWQRGEVQKRFPELGFKKRIIELDIPDIFHFGDPQLVEMIKKRTRKWLS